MPVSYAWSLCTNSRNALRYRLLCTSMAVACVRARVHACVTLVGPSQPSDSPGVYRLGEGRGDYKTTLPSVADRVEADFEQRHLAAWQRICRPEQVRRRVRACARALSLVRIDETLTA